MRNLVRQFVLFVAHTFGTKVIDQRTGEPVGRALIIPWRGKLHVIGLDAAVHPMFQPQTRLTYWKQEIVFTTHPLPDFPNVRNPPPVGESKPKTD
jgi:hypothetical protein